MAEKEDDDDNESQEEVSWLASAVTEMDISNGSRGLAQPDDGFATPIPPTRVRTSSPSSSSALTIKAASAAASRIQSKTATAAAAAPTKLNPASGIFPPYLDPKRLRSPPNLPIRLPPTPKTLLDNQSDFFPDDSISAAISPSAPHHSVMNREMMKALWKHVQRRQPFAQSASAKLQAVVGVRNETPFEVPIMTPPVQPSPPNAPQRAPPSGGARGGIGQWNTSAAARGRPSNDLRGSGRGKGRGQQGHPSLGQSRSFDYSSGNLQSASAHGQDYILPLRAPLSGQPRFVNKQTGEGLREYLLSRGGELGSIRRELKSISFFDSTPDIRTNSPKSTKLAEYENTGPMYRCTYYETDLPVVRCSGNNIPGQQFYGAERWVWILITRPMVTISLDKDVNPSQQMTFPPNFPTPVATSWVVFAAPMSNITVYPITESKITEPLPRINRTNPQPRTGPRILKRLDMDFSHQGVPIFEFCNSQTFNQTYTDEEGTTTVVSSSALPFLAIPRPLPPFSEWNDTYEPYTEEEYEEILSAWEQSDEYKNRTRTIDDPVDLPCPNRGTWWHNFYEALYEDCKNWEKIKAAMARGKCRVICRWIEPENESVVSGGEGHQSASLRGGRGGGSRGRGGVGPTYGRRGGGPGRGGNGRGGTISGRGRGGTGMGHPSSRFAPHPLSKASTQL